MTGKTISHYKILEKIGEGGMGVVYKAQDTRLDRIVALKFLPSHLLLNEDAKARFIHEAKAASALDHPNIATVHDIDSVGGETFISMAYVDGESLKNVAGTQPIPIDRIIDIAIQAAEGLSAAHRKGIVHRDVKSDNIMLTRDGHVKIMDFGLAKLKGVPGVTQVGRTVGTVHYMSPEQARGEDVDRRSDIFSFGVVLYELITGHFPFTGEYEPAVTYSIVNEPHRPMRDHRGDVPTALERIVDKALRKEVGGRYQSMDDLLADLKSLKEGRTEEIIAAGAARGLKRRILIPAIALATAAVALAVGILVQVSKQPPVEVTENILAVMYFENMVDHNDVGRLGEIITNLLITDLSESQFVQVVSSQRLYDILKLLGKEGAKVIDKDVATQVAEKAKAKWMLTGTIMQTAPRLVLTAQIEDLATGRVVKSRRVRGEEGEEVFSVVDKLTLQVKKDLELPDEALSEPDIAVASATTSSPEAYKYYLEGMDYLSKAYFPEAEESFLKALECDSTFALAYFRLAVATGSRDNPGARRAIEKALQYSDKVTHKDMLYIKGIRALMTGSIDEGSEYLEQLIERYPDEKEAYFWLGALASQARMDPNRSIALHTKAIEIDPLYKDPYNMLAYAYEAIGEFDKAIWAINKYISLAPDEANPYDTRGELYGFSGRIDLAIESFEKALEIKPDFAFALQHLGDMWLFKRDYLMAESYYKILASGEDKPSSSAGLARLGLVPLYQGKLREGIRVLEEGIAADAKEGVVGVTKGTKHVLKAQAREAMGDLPGALKEMEGALEIARVILPERPVAYHDYYGCLLAQSGSIGEAERVAEELREDIEDVSPDMMYDYWWLMSDIELAKGEIDSAVHHLEVAMESGPSRAFAIEYSLAVAYLAAGRAADAAAVLEKCESRYGAARALAPIRAVKLYYLLGVAYEESGLPGKAIEQYETFLDIWKDADPGIPEIEDAKRRLERLRDQAVSPS